MSFEKSVAKKLDRYIGPDKFLPRVGSRRCVRYLVPS